LVGKVGVEVGSESSINNSRQRTKPSSLLQPSVTLTASGRPAEVIWITPWHGRCHRYVKNFLMLLPMIVVSRKARVFNRFVFVMRPVQRESDVTDRPGTVRYSWQE